MSRPRLGRKQAHRPLMEALEDRRLLSISSLGTIASNAADFDAEVAQASAAITTQVVELATNQATREMAVPDAVVDDVPATSFVGDLAATSVASAKSTLIAAENSSQPFGDPASTQSALKPKAIIDEAPSMQASPAQAPGLAKTPEKQAPASPVLEAVRTVAQSSDDKFPGKPAPQMRELVDAGAASRQEREDHIPAAPLQQALDVAQSSLDTAQRVVETRFGESDVAPQNGRPPLVQETHEQLAELRQERHAAIVDVAKESLGRADEDHERQQLRAEIIAAYKESRTELRQEVKVLRSSLVGHKVEAVSTAAETRKHEHDGKSGTTNEASPFVPVVKFIRAVERFKAVVSKPTVSDTVVNEPASEVKALAVRANHGATPRVRIDEGQFVLSAEDKATAFQNAPVRNANLLRVSQVVLDLTSKSPSRRLALDGLGQATNGGSYGRAVAAADIGDEVQTGAILYAASQETTAQEETATLEGAGLAAGEMSVSTSALDEALRQFAAGADEVAQALARGLTDYGMLPWLLVAVAGGAAFGLQRRRRHLQSPTPEKLSLAADSELRWAPGMPGSFSDDDA